MVGLRTSVFAHGDREASFVTVGAAAKPIKPIAAHTRLCRSPQLAFDNLPVNDSGKERLREIVDRVEFPRGESIEAEPHHIFGDGIPRDASTRPVAVRSLTQFVDDSEARHERCRRQSGVPAGNLFSCERGKSFSVKACGIA
jgi:hypothetical protein